MVKRYAPRLHKFQDERADIATMEPYLLGAYVSYEEYDKLRDLVERIAQAYGSLPPGKKKATPGVGLAVNAYLNYRRDGDGRSEP